jgi:hypothetical protein
VSAPNQPGTRNSTCDNALLMGDNAVDFAAQFPRELFHHEKDRCAILLRVSLLLTSLSLLTDSFSPVSPQPCDFNSPQSAVAPDSPS